MNAELQSNRQARAVKIRPLVNDDLIEAQERSDAFLAARLRARMARRNCGMDGKRAVAVDFVI